MSAPHTFNSQESSVEQLKNENAVLCERVRQLEEALEEPLSTVHAIREGRIDAVVIDRDAVPEIMTLESASDMYLRLAQRAARVGTWQWDLTTNQVNGSELFWSLLGERPHQHADFSVWEQHIPTDEREKFAAKVEAAVDGDIELCHELGVVAACGEKRCLDIRGRILNASDGSHRRLIGICLDITERKSAEEALRDADRRKDEFLATLAHELRNPLAPIRNSIETLRLVGAGDSSTEQIYETLERQVANLVRIVDDLLEVARISSGKFRIRKEQIEIVPVIKDAIDTSRPLIDAANHQLILSWPDLPLVVEADPLRLGQVVANLLNNSAKYTKPGGKIWLTVEQVASEIQISVRDNGNGIPTEMLPRVFTMFSQLDKDQKHAQGGLGIGLALARNLIELHGGRIEAHSEGSGKGSEFVIHFPAGLQQSPTSAEFPPKDGNRPLTSQRILVVDDNAPGAFALSKLLEKMGNEVRVANTGSLALEILATWRPPLVLLDLGMPDMSGYEVAQRIRQQPELKETLLVALTGWGQSEDRRKTKESGFDHHIVKPVSIDSLRTLLSNAKSPLPRS
jgi:PAS domain S-box-containing protein